MSMPKVTFDLRIDLGHLLTFGAMVVAGAMWFAKADANVATADGRLSRLEKIVEHQDESIQMLTTNHAVVSAILGRMEGRGAR